MIVVFNDRELNINSRLNWGDLIPYKIIKVLSKSKKLVESDVFNVREAYLKHLIYSTGSIMAFTNTNCIVWGSGCIQPNAVGQPPKKVYSVRGPMTREILINKGIQVDEVYGDPALLYPLIYNPKIEKKYKWGIIPHYIEFKSDIGIKTLRHLEAMGIRIIDICAGEDKFIDELLEVENVLSSSLHGLIAADAYGIPNARVRITNQLIGGDFKFLDYYLSVGREADFGLQLTNNTNLNEIEELKLNREIDFNSEEYLKHAPWINNEYDLF